MEHARPLDDERPDPVLLTWGIVVHYHEIGLKGRNRGSFERQLVRNIERVVGSSGARVETLNGRLLVHTDGPPSTALVALVAAAFGVAVCSPAAIVRSDIDAITDAALALAADRTFASFAVAARRATKEFHMSSRDINIHVGAAVQSATGSAVNLGAPDVTFHIEVVGRRTFVYADRIEGAGGLPVGSSGKVVALLSGGIDSPVAVHRIMKRGAKAILCHFHSAPFTDLSSARKASELARVIADRQGTTTLYKIAIGEAQQQIVVTAPPELRVVLYRRLMMRIAGLLAAQEGGKALVTGDSLGQVASQTLENIACTDDVARVPVLRPLIGWDKQEIVDAAQGFGTYEISIQPFEDCCSLFVPRSPATRASIDQCRSAEADIDMDELAEKCFAAAEVERIDA